LPSAEEVKNPVSLVGATERLFFETAINAEEPRGIKDVKVRDFFS
jgi:hypothetical protein